MLISLIHLLDERVDKNVGELMVKEDFVFDFVLPISNRDVTACKALISEIIKQVPNDAAAWEQPLTSLLKERDE